MQKRRGQVGLILLVIMGLVVGIALSLASRSLGDTVLSRQESESAKAFRLAESGVEQALNSLRQGSVPEAIPLSGDGVFTGNAAVAAQTGYGLTVKEGEQAHLDVVGYSGALTIYWTKKDVAREDISGCAEGSGNAPAAVEVITHLSNGSATFAYYNAAGCSLGNSFASADSSSGEYRSEVTIMVNAGSEAIRIRPIYSDATIAVSGTGLATQLYLIQSRATGGEAQKEIEVRRGLDAPPSIFDYAVFSGSALEK